LLFSTLSPTLVDCTKGRNFHVAATIVTCKRAFSVHIGHIMNAHQFHVRWLYIERAKHRSWYNLEHAEMVGEQVWVYDLTQ